MCDDRKWKRLTPNSFSKKSVCNEVGTSLKPVLLLNGISLKPAPRFFAHYF